MTKLVFFKNYFLLQSKIYFIFNTFIISILEIMSIGIQNAVMENINNKKFTNAIFSSEISTGTSFTK